MERTRKMLLEATGTQRDEVERRKALQSYAILDTLPDPALDELARLAAQLCRAPCAYIGFLDADRIWFKSRVGFTARELPRTSSAMEFTLLAGAAQDAGVDDIRVDGSSTELLRDAALDGRFPPAGIPLDPGIACRSYASASLLTPGGVGIGTLTVLSPDPDAFTREDVALLEVLGRQVMTRLELYSREGMQERVIRARQRIERALLVERNFVSAVLETMNAPVLVLDTAGRVVRFNHACERISGYKFGELAGRSFPEQLFLPDEREKAIEIFDQVRARTQRGNYELHWQPRTGRRRCISWTATTLTDIHGEVNFIVTSGVDVTDQQEAEVALRSSEMRYRMLVEGTMGFVWTQDLEGRLLSINTQGAKVLGYKVEDLIGKQITELMTPEQGEAFNARQHLAQPAEPQASGGGHALERRSRPRKRVEEEQGMMQLVHRNGSICVVAYSNRLLQLPDTDPFLLGHGIDITDKTEAEEKLHMLMRQRESILDSVGDGICGMDMEGRLTFMNQSGARLLGYEVAEVLGRDMHDLLHHTRADGSPYPKGECPISKSLHELTPIRVSNELYWRKDGTSFPVEYVACPLVDDGRTTGIVVAFQDVTERRQLDKMKDEFISTVSHELRTPLTSLRGALGLLSSGLLEKRPDKTTQMLLLAVGNCDRLERLVNDILDFERIGSGGFVLHASERNVSDLLRHAAEQQQMNAGKSGLRFRIDAEPVDVWVDGEHILQALSNLIGNAIKFSHPGGEIRLRAYGSSEQEVTIEVTDQGRGIPPEKLEKIFERFHQLDASDTRALGGTGLGLAICKSIVTQHGGRIWAESAPGEGSTFFFTLPRYTPGGSSGAAIRAGDG